MTKLNATTRLTAGDPHDRHLDKIINAINHSGIRGAHIYSDGQEIVVATQQRFNVHMLGKFAEQMHVHPEHISIEPGSGVVELRIPEFVIGK
jgi:demethoxyubiquinone hydroxylase (CLK1/Coq7/Cat5 family)